MSDLIEKEIKVLISKLEYDTLSENLNWKEEFLQENYYYLDKEGEIRKKDITVRIRKKEGKLKLQTKMPIQCQNALKIKEEKEIEVDEIYEEMGRDIYADLIDIYALNLYKVGKLITKRKIITFPNCEIALDENHYCNKYDYELEIEYTEDEVPRNILDTIIALVDIDFSKCSKGKNRRFLAEYDQFNKLI